MHIPESCENAAAQRATAALQRFRLLSRPQKPITVEHKRANDIKDSDAEKASCQAEDEKTIFYLAYGSNLAASTFLGRRGIKPLRAVNVVVPSLRLTFDLPGIPYSEPCFANSGSRVEDETEGLQDHNGLHLCEKTPLLKQTARPLDYHKDRWHKGMVGVVYELTPTDFYHVIATEGGGASYNDVVVDAYPLKAGESTVPVHPTTQAIQAHTLFAPARKPPPPPPPQHDSAFSTRHFEDNEDRYVRPDPAYAQPSARYIGLLRTGAEEHQLPQEYKDYLAQIRPYSITTRKQRLGQFIFLATWMPIVTALMQLANVFQDERGRSPPWLVSLFGALFKGVWGSYDGFFSPTFGDGERTIGDGIDDDHLMDHHVQQLSRT